MSMWRIVFNVKKKKKKKKWVYEHTMGRTWEADVSRGQGLSEKLGDHGKQAFRGDKA